MNHTRPRIIHASTYTRQRTLEVRVLLQWTFEQERQPTTMRRLPTKRKQHRHPGVPMRRAGGKKTAMPAETPLWISGPANAAQRALGLC